MVRRVIAAIGVVLILSTVSCGGDRPDVGDAVTEGTVPQRDLDPDVTYVAVPPGPVEVFAEPDAAEPTQTVEPPAADPADPAAVPGFFLKAPYEQEAGWHEIYLADGSAGWVHADAVQLEIRNVVAVARGTEIDNQGNGGGAAPVFNQPGAAQPNVEVENPKSADGRNVGPVVFLVKGAYDPNAEWLQVWLPLRPNGTTGWVRRADMDVTFNRFRIEVELGDHVLRLFDGGDQVLEEPIGVGTDNTPTPGGVFYIRSLIASTDPAYGTYAFGLSGFSEVHQEFNGGPGDIGIHGTNDSSSIGSDVSNGCIRLNDNVVIDLARRLPEAIGPQADDPQITTGLGIPVQVIA